MPERAWLQYVRCVFTQPGPQADITRRAMSKIKASLSFTQARRIGLISKMNRCGVVTAGRTDACAQVTHFDSSAVRSDHVWLRGVNSNLPRTRGGTVSGGR